MVLGLSSPENGGVTQINWAPWSTWNGDFFRQSKRIPVGDWKEKVSPPSDSSHDQRLSLFWAVYFDMHPITVRHSLRRPMSFWCPRYLSWALSKSVPCRRARHRRHLAEKFLWCSFNVLASHLYRVLCVHNNCTFSHTQAFPARFHHLLIFSVSVGFSSLHWIFFPAFCQLVVVCTFLLHFSSNYFEYHQSVEG